MREPSRRSRRLFLSGDYERLYLGAGSRVPTKVHLRPRPEPFVYLCEGSHRFWALVLPVDSYTGRVAWSNVLPPGTLVKSRKSWRFAAMRKDSRHPQTLASPRFLKVLGLPPRPKLGKAHQRLAIPLRQFSLIAA